MAIYTFRIVGVHYAVNPDSASHEEETELMHQRTAQRLRELDEVRPPVVLIPEPSNPADARAVMARVDGGRIGYVATAQLDAVHAILSANGGRPIKAHIESVEAKKHGWMNVCVESEEEVCMESQNQCDSVWKGWTCALPVLPTIESQFAMMEAEAMLDDKNGKESVVNLSVIERYIRLWLTHSLHDLSLEARLTREHYIMWLKETVSQNATSSSGPLPQIRALVSELEKQRTAICGQKRSNLRVGKWWKELLASKEMEQLWKTWVARMNGDMELGMSELDTPLKALPNDLYGFIDDKKLFFSRLHYLNVPRVKYWQIISLMLLREYTQLLDAQNGANRNDAGMEGGRETRHPLEEGEEKFEVTIPKELQTPEAKKVLARLQKKGILDADLQPSTLVGWQKGVLAYELAERLRIARKWVVMATLWACSDQTLRQYYTKNFNEDKAIQYSKKMKAIIA